MVDTVRQVWRTDNDSRANCEKFGDATVDTLVFVCSCNMTKYSRGLWGKCYEGMRDVRAFIGNLGKNI